MTTATTSSIILECRGLVRQYGGSFALGPLDLELGTGVTCLVGANGAGKSTLFRLLSGVDSPTAGEVRRDGPASLGYLPQSPLLPPRATAREFLHHVAWLQRVPRSERAARVVDVLERVGLGKQADQQIRALSGGMARRLGIAHALVHQPTVLLLDEPTVGLDPRQRVGVRQVVSGLTSDSVVLVSTHLVEDVRGLADRVLILSDGQLAFDGTVSDLELLADPAAPGDTELERALACVMGGAE